jgi:hypothetical protein
MKAVVEVGSAAAVPNLDHEQQTNGIRAGSEIGVFDGVRKAKFG